MFLRFLVILASVLTLACLAGCPKNGSQTGAEANPSAGAQDSVAGELETPGSNVLKLYSDVVEINQPFKVEYQLLQSSDGDAWIALVPAAVSSKLLKDNVPHAVDRVTLPAGNNGTVELTASNVGKYAVRLFLAQTGEILAVAEAQVSAEESLPGDTLEFTPPYVTISGRKLEQVPEQVVGFPMIAYWEMAEVQGEDAWLGMIPTSCTVTDAATNLDAAVDVQFLDGKTKYSSIFQLSQPGEFLFRIFASKDAEQMLCESQIFRVVEKQSVSATPTE